VITIIIQEASPSGRAVDNLFNVSLTDRAQDSHRVQTKEGLAAPSGSLLVMRNCLLIDQNVAERQRLKGMLESLGFDCATASDSAEGLRQCSESMPSVVMMEASGGADPRAFVNHPHAPQTAPPVVIMYADGTDAIQVGKTLCDGAAEFLHKPFSMDLLRFKLRQVGLFTH
jgi:DNA-binding NtrC family response regulator